MHQQNKDKLSWPYSPPRNLDFQCRAFKRPLNTVAVPLLTASALRSPLSAAQPLSFLDLATNVSSQLVKQKWSFVKIYILFNAFALCLGSLFPQASRPGFQSALDALQGEMHSQLRWELWLSVPDVWSLVIYGSFVLGLCSSLMGPCGKVLGRETSFHLKMVLLWRSLFYWGFFFSFVFKARVIS